MFSNRRLAGITQINNQIGVLAEICVGETLPEAEAVPRHMADWLISNNIISHIFGPNLHVEVGIFKPSPNIHYTHLF